MSFAAYLGAVVEAEARSGASEKELERMIEEIIGIFKDPIVLYPGGWEHTLPPAIWEMIRTQRFIQQLKAKGKPIDEATDAEAMAYLYSASLVAPMSDEWARIYVWLGRDLLPKDEAGTSMAPKALTPDEVRILTDFKRWIYRKKTAGRRNTKPYPLEKAFKKKARRKPAMGCPFEPEIIEAE